MSNYYTRIDADSLGASRRNRPSVLFSNLNLTIYLFLLLSVVAKCGQQPLLTDFSILPNPAIQSDTIKINFELSERGQVTTDFFDAGGKPVYSFGENEFTSGSHEQIYPTNNLEPGVYSVQLNVRSTESTKDTVCNKKLVITSS